MTPIWCRCGATLENLELYEIHVTVCPSREDQRLIDDLAVRAAKALEELRTLKKDVAENSGKVIADLQHRLDVTDKQLASVTEGIPHLYKFLTSKVGNYVELHAENQDHEKFVITYQRMEGKTPHDFRLEAEKERDEAIEKYEGLAKAYLEECGRPRYAQIPESNHIIRRCERCSGPVEVPIQLCSVGITSCRACVAEHKAADLVAALVDIAGELRPRSDTPGNIAHKALAKHAAEQPEW